MLFLSLTLTKNQEYLLGATSEGELYVWLFEELLMEYLSEKFEGENIFNHICHFKLKEGKIFNLKLAENELDTLFFNDDYSLYSYSWSDLLAEIKDKRLLGYPGIKFTKFLDQPRSKLNIHQEFGEDFQKISSLDYDLKGKRCILGTSKGNILIVNLEDLTKNKLITPLKSTISLEDNLLAINAIKYYRDNFLLFGNEKGQVKLWNFEINQEVKSYKLEKEPLSPVRCIQTDKESRWVVIGHSDYITRWHLESATLASAMPALEEVNCLLVGDTTIFSGHNGKNVYQWNEAGDFVTKAEASVSCVTTLIGDADHKEKIMISGGNGHLIDVFLNSSRVVSFLA